MHVPSIFSKRNDDAPIKRSLSTRLLYLTIIFVLIAEAFVLIPSLAKNRIDWLKARVEASYLVSLAISSEEGRVMSDAMADRLLETANVKGVRFWRNGEMQTIRVTTLDPERSKPLRSIELNPSWVEFLTAPWSALFSTGDNLIAVRGKSGYDENSYVDIFVSQADLRADLWIYLRNILFLSLVISAITAGLLYNWLNKDLIAPVKRLLNNMAAFEANPEDPNTIMKPSGRFDDELLAAQRSLASMEQRTHDLLEERRRLAALGAGISKISHDLRNILASAQLMSDRVAKSDDPRVRRLSPRLISALDRAISLSRDTLSFAKMGPSHLKKETADIRKLVDDVYDATATMTVTQFNETPEGVRAHIDPTHLYRAIFNIVRNAIDAMSPDQQKTSPEGDDRSWTMEAQKNIITVTATVKNEALWIDIQDTGPGVPEQARAHLFEPFKGSLKPGGSGLGIAIAAEIARAHGGHLELAASNETGSTFRFTLPIGVSGVAGAGGAATASPLEKASN